MKRGQKISAKKIQKEMAALENMKIMTFTLEEKIQEMVHYTVVKTRPKLANHDLRATFLRRCPQSPFGYCVYDLTIDSAMDECIYCGNPYKRK